MKFKIVVVTCKAAFVIFLVTLYSVAISQYDHLSRLNAIQPANASNGMPTDNPLKNRLDSSVHSLTTNFMATHEMVGVSLGIIKDGQTLRYNYGTVEKGKRQLPTSKSQYELASVTKTFTGILLAQAILDKKLSLQDDIRKYMPGNFFNLEYQGNPIRIQHLASHSSGITHQLPDLSQYTSGFDVLKMYDSYTNDKFFADLRSIKINKLPGSIYAYSNVGIKLLGIILEQVYQMSYGELLKKFITRPFGMSTTKTSPLVSDTVTYMKGYEDGNTMPHINFNIFGGAGSVLSTVDDMLTYLQQNITEKNAAVRLSHQQIWSDSSHKMGLCWEIDRGHKYGTVFKKDGGALGFRTYALVIPEKRTGIIWLSNKAGIGHEVGIMINELLDQILAER